MTPSSKIASAFKTFCNYTCLGGYVYLFKQHFSTAERTFWLIINLTAIVSTCFYVSVLWQTISLNWTVVYLDTLNYHISEVEFPGIAICNINKFSRQQVMSYARTMYDFDRSNELQFYIDGITTLASLYDSKPGSEEAFVDFQMNIEKSWSEKYGAFDGFFDSTPLLKQLAPKCEDMLQNCSWDGETKDCMEIFATRRSHLGFCCVFNYLRPPAKPDDNDIDKVPTEIFHSQKPGSLNGLTVQVNNNLTDYFYTNLATTGVIVSIFYPYDYPDKASGGLTEVLVQDGVEGFMSITADTIKSTHNLKSTPISKRRCILDNDGKTTIFGNYRSSDCNVHCKIESMMSLCDCIPFNIPVNKDIFSGFRTCTLSDVPCLSKFKRKWMTIFPKETNAEDLELDKHDSTYCEFDCPPSCDNTEYFVNTNLLTLSSGNNNRSVIHIYFDNLYMKLFKLDVVNTWFEILSNFGGVFSFFMGLSLINFVEIAFFLIYRLLISKE